MSPSPNDHSGDPLDHDDVEKLHAILCKSQETQNRLVEIVVEVTGLNEVAKSLRQEAAAMQDKTIDDDHNVEENLEKLGDIIRKIKETSNQTAQLSAETAALKEVGRSLSEEADTIHDAHTKRHADGEQFQTQSLTQSSVSNKSLFCIYIFLP